MAGSSAPDRGSAGSSSNGDEVVVVILSIIFLTYNKAYLFITDDKAIYHRLGRLSYGRGSDGHRSLFEETGAAADAHSA